MDNYNDYIPQDAMPERVPPHNAEAERAVLGSALTSVDAFLDVSEILRAEDFYDPKHSSIFRVMTRLFTDNTPIDVLTVCETLSKAGELEAAGGRAYVAQLAGEVPTAANAGEYAKIVAEKSVMRGLINAANDIIKDGYGEGDATYVLDKAEQSIFEISQKKQHKDFTSIEDVMVRNIETIEKLAESDRNITGLSTGFIDLDYKLSGLHKSDLIILAARPSMGKTSLALNIAQQTAAIEDATVLIFSLEMGADQIGQRLLSVQSQVPMGKIQSGKLSTDDWDSVNDALTQISSCKIFIDDTPNISLLEMKNKARRLHAEKGLDFIVIDYLQLMNMESAAKEGRQQEVSTICRNLKQMARELDCPVMVLSQLSRASDQRPDHRPQLADLRDSGSIEQDADIVLFIYREDYYDKDLPKQNFAEVFISKHRQGATGVVTLGWQPESTRFTNWTAATGEEYN